MKGYDRAITYRDEWTEIWTNRLQQRRTEITGTQAQLEVLNCRQRDAGEGGRGGSYLIDGCPLTITGAQLNKYSLPVAAVI